MRGFLPLLFFLQTLPAATAIQCGGRLTTECLGATDVRYNPGASNALKDQAVIWQILEGYYRCEQRDYNASTGFPLLESNPYPFHDGNTSLFPYYYFFNHTVDGSRSYSHFIYVYESRFQGGTGDCGVAERWAVSSYEKDGTAIVIGTNDGYVNEWPNDAPLYIYAVDNRTLVLSGKVASGFSAPLDYSEIYHCYNNQCDQFGANQDSFLVYETAIGRRGSQSIMNCTRIATADEWLTAIETAYETYKVPDAYRVALPMEECFTGACPTEQEWCQKDPQCSTSPYQEPPASVKPGAIAGFTIAGLIVLIIAMYLLHRWSLSRQQSRYKTVFAQRIADTIDVNKSMRTLPPQALAEEFAKIDSQQKDGVISKDELWEFLSTGKAGEMSKSDFNALFTAIDLDNNGTVDFLEFCSFIAKCNGEYAKANKARIARGSFALQTAARLSVRDVAATRLSTAGDTSAAAAAASAAAGAELETADEKVDA